MLEDYDNSDYGWDQTYPTLGGWVRGRKKVCVPKIGLLVGPLDKFHFFPQETTFLMWVVGSAGVCQAPNEGWGGLLCSSLLKTSLGFTDVATTKDRVQCIVGASLRGNGVLWTRSSLRRTSLIHLHPITDEDANFCFGTQIIALEDLSTVESKKFLLTLCYWFCLCLCCAFHVLWVKPAWGPWAWPGRVWWAAPLGLGQSSAWLDFTLIS